MNASYYITQLKLLPHPEGGYFKETYRSSGTIAPQYLPTNFNGERHFATAIYFMLQAGDFSAFHRIKSDECWHFYEGESLLIHIIDPYGTYTRVQLGKNMAQGDVYQFVVPARCWFASELMYQVGFALVGCTVAPGFDFTDFELAKAAILSGEYPQHTSLIQRLCR